MAIYFRITIFFPRFWLEIILITQQHGNLNRNNFCAKFQLFFFSANSCLELCFTINFCYNVASEELFWRRSGIFAAPSASGGEAYGIVLLGKSLFASRVITLCAQVSYCAVFCWSLSYGIAFISTFFRLFRQPLLYRWYFTGGRFACKNVICGTAQKKLLIMQHAKHALRLAILKSVSHAHRIIHQLSSTFCRKSRTR